MGIALLTLSSLIQGFTSIQRAVATARPPAPARGLRTSAPFHRSVSRSPHRPAGVCVAAPLVAKSTLAPTPLRVVRMSESGEHRGAAGRMVISGRMADVCAELDRLVAKEAAAFAH